MRLASVAVLALLAVLLGWLFLGRESATPSGPAPASRPASCPSLAPVPVGPAPAPAPARVRWLALGAVEAPELNQVSLEQDAELLREVLGPSGIVLHAGGPASRDVQVASAEKRGDTFLLELADLLTPRGGRASRYRRSRIARHGAATREEIERWLERLLGAGGAPLLVYLGGHGEMGETARQGHVTLWGGERLTVAELADWLDRGRTTGRPGRPVRVVVTTCFSGAFAELLFRGADPARGVAPGRCGFFSTASDLPAAGCDPDPDREHQEGYALHLLNALRWRDRSGQPLDRASVDLDGDGRVSLAEAHARARMDLDSVDVPTSTSERWLREVAPRQGPRASLPLPEERAVVQTLAGRSGLPAELAAARAALSQREAAIELARQKLDRASADEDRAARAAIAELLARWPMLDDPWHPEFTELLRCQRRAIEAHLRASTAYARFREARDAAEDAEHRHWDLRRRAAPLERLARALENIELAEKLRARGGAAWQTLASILACERGVP